MTGSGLPDIVRTVTIDGFTQPGSGFGAPLIQLDGSATIPGTSGLTLSGVSGCLIRGLNIVNFDGGPLDAGIHIAGGSNNRVQGNVIGIGAGGNVALGNRQGVLINTGASGNIVGTDGDGVADASEGNLISGNPSAGVFVNGNGNRVAGNLIGTNAAGTATPGSHILGVLISQGTDNIVGTNGDGISDDLESNLISGSRGNGAEIAGSSSTGNRIAGNRIGTDITGTLPVPNESGVVISGGASGNIIGTNGDGSGDAAEGNIIALNSLVGVAILGDDSTGNRISRNSIFANGRLGGIDLIGDGVTPNDPGDADAGPNDLLNFPVLTAAQLAGTDLVLEGFARPGSAIELFVADPDPSGFGQGRTYLVTRVEGSADDLDPGTGSYGPGPVNGLDVGSDTTNRFRFVIPLASLPGVAVGTALTATATLAGNTSEFSGNVTVAATVMLSGTVFEDVNYGGGAGRTLAASGGVGRDGVTVELYDAAGNFLEATTTAGGGAYSFAVAANASYSVRVVNGTVTSSRAGSTPSLLSVQTFRTDASTGTPAAVTGEVGGAMPSAPDGPAKTTGGTLGDAAVEQSVTAVGVGTAPIGGLDFGFNFDTVVNTNDAGQGSLRQFITNSNALGNGGLAQADTLTPIPAGWRRPSS